MPPFASERAPPVEFPAFEHALPIEVELWQVVAISLSFSPFHGLGWPLLTVAAVELLQGDMLYLPAFWYHAVQGGDGFNVVLAWWAQVHPNKRDDASGAFEPTRPTYEGPGFMEDAVDELKFAESEAKWGAADTP